MDSNRKTKRVRSGRMLWATENLRLRHSETHWTSPPFFAGKQQELGRPPAASTPSLSRKSRARQTALVAEWLRSTTGRAANLGLAEPS